MAWFEGLDRPTTPTEAAEKLVELTEKGWDPLAVATAAIEQQLNSLVTGMAPAIEIGLSSGMRVMEKTVGPKVEAMFDGLVDMLRNTITSGVSTSFDQVDFLAPRSPDGALDATVNLLGLFGVSAAGLGAATLIGELVQPLKNLGLGHLAAVFYDLAGFRPISNVLTTTMARIAIGRSLEYELNSVFRPWFPDRAQISDMVGRELITKDEFETLMGYQGVKVDFLDRLHTMSFRPPGAQDLSRMISRDLITEDDFKDALRMQRVPEIFRDAYLELTHKIPGANDLVRFVVREVMTYPEFQIWLGRQGFTERWATAYWAAHWVLVPLERLFSMFYRGIIDEDEMKRQLVFHDFKPAWVDKLIEVDKRLPTRTLARFIYDVFPVDDDTIDYWLKASGYHEDALPYVRAYVKSFRVRAVYGRIETAARRGYRQGIVSRDQFMELLRYAQYSEDVIVAELYLANLERSLDAKGDMIGYYVDAYRREVITEDDLYNYLAELGMEDDAAGLTLATEVLKKAPRPKAITF